MRIFLTIMFVFSLTSYGQNLLEERIWKISDRKRSIFLDKGIFHSTLKSDTEKTLTNIRNSYKKNQGYERLVFDFNTSSPPKVYGHISSNGKISIDFFNTKLKSSVGMVKNVKYIKDLLFYNIDKKNLSVEINFKAKISVDVFYLNNPGRLVIDIKK